MIATELPSNSQSLCTQNKNSFCCFFYHIPIIKIEISRTFLLGSTISLSVSFQSLPPPGWPNEIESKKLCSIFTIALTSSINALYHLYTSMPNITILVSKNNYLSYSPLPPSPVLPPYAVPTAHVSIMSINHQFNNSS